jgi:hypothetical protein
MWNEMLRNCEYKIHSFAAEGKPDELRCSKKVPELKKVTGGGKSLSRLSGLFRQACARQ